MPARLNITGRVFGHLTALWPLRVNKHGQYIWLCVCDCGRTAEVMVSHLKSEHTKSCGCRQGGRLIAGNEHLRTRRVWAGILYRCRHRPGYADRGIGVCSRWSKFENFLADMGEIPDAMTIERVDNDAGYFPENCVWAPMDVQNRNKRNNHRVSYQGREYVLTDLAAKHGADGVYASLISIRLKRGWPLEKALATTPRRRKGAA